MLRSLGSPFLFLFLFLFPRFDPFFFLLAFFTSFYPFLFSFLLVPFLSFLSLTPTNQPTDRPDKHRLLSLIGKSSTYLSPGPLTLHLTCPSFFLVVVFIVFHSLASYIYYHSLISDLCIVCVVPPYNPLTC